MTDVNALITEHLDIWTSAIEKKSSAGRGSSGKVKLHGINKLRGLILELAVRGRLVRQNSEDGDAASILTQIGGRKAALLREKAIKKPKAIKPMPDDFHPFEVPSSWRMEQLGELSFLITDGTHHTPKYIQTGIPFISVKDINGRTVSFEDCKYISGDEHQKINDRCNPEKGDLLICRIGTLGRATLVDTDVPFSLFVSVGLIKFFQDLLEPGQAFFIW